MILIWLTCLAVLKVVQIVPELCSQLMNFLQRYETLEEGPCCFYIVGKGVSYFFFLGQLAWICLVFTDCLVGPVVLTLCGLKRGEALSQRAEVESGWILSFHPLVATKTPGYYTSIGRTACSESVNVRWFLGHVDLGGWLGFRIKLVSANPARRTTCCVSEGVSSELTLAGGENVLLD